MINFYRADDDEEEYQSKFASDLAMMDTEEIDYEVELGDGPEAMDTSQRWSRPDLPLIDPKKDSVIFQQIDIDHYNGLPMHGMPGAQVR